MVAPHIRRGSREREVAKVVRSTNQHQATGVGSKGSSDLTFRRRGRSSDDQLQGLAGRLIGWERQGMECPEPGPSLAEEDQTVNQRVCRENKGQRWEAAQTGDTRLPSYSGSWRQVEAVEEIQSVH